MQKQKLFVFLCCVFFVFILFLKKNTKGLYAREKMNGGWIDDEDQMLFHGEEKK